MAMNKKLILDAHAFVDKFWECELLNVCCAPKLSVGSRLLSDLMEEMEETFSECLLRLIDQRGVSDSEIYKKAMVDRRLFSKIKNNREYRPKKVTVLAFAFALELDLDGCLDLLKRAGFTLSRSDLFDVVIEFCFLNDVHDLMVVNEILNEFDLPLFGF